MRQRPMIVCAHKCALSFWSTDIYTNHTVSATMRPLRAMLRKWSDPMNMLTTWASCCPNHELIRESFMLSLTFRFNLTKVNTFSILSIYLIGRDPFMLSLRRHCRQLKVALPMPLEFMHRLAVMNRILTPASRQDHAVTYNELYFSLASVPRWTNPLGAVIVPVT